MIYRLLSRTALWVCEVKIRRILASFTSACEMVLLINSTPCCLMLTRNSFALFLMLPLAVFLWFFGWKLYWIGLNKKKTRSEKKESSKLLAFSVLIPEQKYAE